jgi:hypothetical protein
MGPGGEEETCGGLFDEACADMCHRMGACGELCAILAPYNDGGRSLRWFDVAVDALWFTRAHTWNNVPLTSQNFALNVPPNIVLSTGQLATQDNVGFRFLANIQLGASQSTEFVYFGPFHFMSSAAVADPTGQLFSTFSNFGTDNPPFGFAETDLATIQKISYLSQLDNFEWNFRQRWQAPNGRFQGSYLAGIRYVKIDERLRLHSEGPNAFFDYLQQTTNSLTGAQIGGDLWVTPIAGFRVGVEAKAGVYGNYATNTSEVRAFSFPGTFDDRAIGDAVSFVGDLSGQFTYRVNYHWTIRGGYNGMVATGLALAPNNFNRAPPANLTPAPIEVREPFIHLRGYNWYHGANLGLEYLW